MISSTVSGTKSTETEARPAKDRAIKDHNFRRSLGCKAPPSCPREELAVDLAI